MDEDGNLLSQNSNPLSQNNNIFNNSKGPKVSKLSQVEQDKENSDVHVPRPRNAFMIFSCEWRKKNSLVYSGVSNRQVCTLLGKLWRSLSAEEKEPFYTEASRLKDEHKAKYPDYQYSPIEARAKKAARPVTLRKNGLPRKRYTSSKAARKLNFSPPRQKFEMVDIKEEPTSPPTEEIITKDINRFAARDSSTRRSEFPLTENCALENDVDSSNTVSLHLDDIMGVDAMEADSFVVLNGAPLGYPLSRYEEQSTRLSFGTESLDQTQ